MEQRLRTYVQSEHRARCARWLAAELYAAHLERVGGKLRAAYERVGGRKLLHGCLLLHLCKSFKAFLHRLRRKTVAVNHVDFLAAEHKVLDHEQRIIRQEAQEGHFLINQRSHLGHYFYALTLVARQLALHLERAYGVYFVAEEVDAERIFAAEREHIYYAAAHGELPRLIHVVNLVEAELP